MKRIIIAVVIALFSCSTPVPLSVSLVKKYQLAPEDLTNLQVYVVNDYLITGIGEAIKIYEYTATEKEKLAKKDLILSEQYASSEFVVPNNTPCIISRVEGNADKLYIRCSNKDPRELLFGKIEGMPTDYYYLLTVQKGNKYYTRFGDTLALVTQESSKAYLKINVKKIRKAKQQTKVAEGVKLK